MMSQRRCEWALRPCQFVVSCCTCSVSACHPQCALPPARPQPSPSTHPSQPTPPHLPNAAPACRRFNDAGIPWEPFHLKREREEGYFDEVSALKWQNPCPCTAPGHCWLLLQMRWRDVLPVGVPLGTRL